jgi:adenine-specific DNA-methyltransferase
VASVSVLYIDDEIVGPHLELLRNVCEPFSMSRPHVTVRYFERLPVTQEHLSTSVRYIDLIEPAAFGLDVEDEGPNRTVYIRCEADDLLQVEHKPHYPTSEFHITVYDGHSLYFARALLRVLKSVVWRFRVPLPDKTKLTELPIKARRPGTAPTSRVYSPKLKKVFQDATSQELSWSALVQLSDEARLELVRAIVEHLRIVTAAYQRIDDVVTQTIDDTRVRIVGASEPEVHLTPPELARDIAEYAVGMLENANVPLHFGDPAVGTGAFYAALLHAVPRAQVASAIGIDISDRQVAAAKWRWAPRGMDVRQGDYLHMERLPPRTLILANPPYLRHQGIHAPYKQELRARASVVAGMEVSARSGLYVYFLLLSHPWMEPDAVAGWLIPSEFMQTNYGDVVRHYLTHQVELVRVHQFSHDHPQFENAKVLPAVVFFRNRIPQKHHKVLLTAGGSLREPGSCYRESIEELRGESRWFVPRRALGQRVFSSFRVGDLFEVRRGIATGANDYFILEKTTAESMGLPEEALRPVLPKARALSTDIIERNKDGYPDTTPQLCLLDCDLSLEEIEHRFPTLMNYLRSAESLGILNRNLVRSRKPWYKQERRAPAPFLCTYMGRGKNNTPPLRFIWNKSDAVATNTYLMLYPRPKLASLLNSYPNIAEELFALLRETARTSMSNSSRMHADGLHKIEPGDLVNVPFASTPPWIQQAVDSDLLLGPDL